MEDIIDLTPTWGQIGLLAMRLAESREVEAFRHLKPDIARAMAAAQALQAIESRLSDGQRAIVSRVLAEELAKQGYSACGTSTPTAEVK